MDGGLIAAMCGSLVAILAGIYFAFKKRDKA